MDKAYHEGICLRLPVGKMTPILDILEQIRYDVSLAQIFTYVFTALRKVFCHCLFLSGTATLSKCSVLDYSSWDEFILHLYHMPCYPMYPM